MVHCSGGGQTKVLHFIDNLHVVKNDLFDIPPLFELIQSESSTPWMKCIRYLIWDIEWRYILILLLQMILFPYAHHLIWMLK